ncbi:hypothetical protein [Serratia sp. DD3]|uniref:hypothetical protein n=1 Tax=Serratia sp. DD3 TaxID=1410619 RepID=UPI0004D95108|nr:hypothetical protein [Serratia sp. DD3]KEY60414.1 hypothetical protein SRDD_05720 [Serratia sp. DD3]
MKIKFLNNLLNKIKKDQVNDFTSIFSKGNFQEVSDSKKYPCITSLIKDNTYAYRMFFCMDKKFTQGIIDVINDAFESSMTFEKSRDIVILSKNKAVALNVYNDFGGEVVRLITNSEHIINSIWKLNITPPPPWVAFPEIDPDGLGSMQGNLSFWWDWMWLPFWNSMDGTKKKDYLTVNFAPLNWVEYFNFHEVNISK